jgi:hypothetical protein
MLEITYQSISEAFVATNSWSLKFYVVSIVSEEYSASIVTRFMDLFGEGPEYVGETDGNI